MGKQRDLPRVLNQTSFIKLLETEGWTHAIGGKHSVKMVKTGERPITLPRHKGRDYSASLTSDILRQAGLRGGDPSQ